MADCVPGCRNRLSLSQCVKACCLLKIQAASCGAQAALLDIRKQQAAASSASAEAEDSTAVLQLLGVAKTLLANVSTHDCCCLARLNESGINPSLPLL